MLGRFKMLIAAAAALFALPGATAPGAPPVPATDTALATACSALPAADFSAVADAPTQVTSATWAVAAPGIPAHCAVMGYVNPNVGIELHLPAQWNGKFAKIGCGGFCGNTFGARACAGLLSRGYACVMSDMGHRSTALDGKWAYNNLQAKFDFGIRAAHVSTLAGKAITAAFYGSGPRRAYYMGCSTGGRQGMMEAQRFPNDFDGIVAGAPVINELGDGLTLMWNSVATLAKDGSQLFGPQDIRTLHEAVVAACDMNDGVKDGLIGDARSCRFDPGVLQCKPGATGGQCLSVAQVAAVRKIYGGPVDSKGQTLFPAAALPGSEPNWINTYIGANGKPSTYYTFVGDLFRYMAFYPDAGPAWQPTDMDWDVDPWRLDLGESLFNAQNPDLRRFKARGGKLLVYHGWSDQSVLTQPVIDYYETATRTMGGPQATRDFFRLFMIPGMNHCTGGDGAYQVDYLAYLDKWVEQGEAPDVLMGQHPAADAPALPPFGADPLPADKVAFSRPHFAYPALARYAKGDPNKAASFVSSTPKGR